MRWHVDISPDARDQLLRFPPAAQRHLQRAIDDFEEKDDSLWTNIKALQGRQWKGRFRKRVGDYRIIFRKIPERTLVEISAVLIKAKDTYR